MCAATTLGSGNATTSPQSVKQGTAVMITSDVIPVIFIPGIMGSNIKDKSGKKVWDLPNQSTVKNWSTTMEVGSSVKNRWTKTPKQLQEELYYKNTLVDDRGYIAVDSKLSSMGLNEKILRARGWGTVHWDSYGAILTYLQMHLNNVAIDKPPAPKYDSRAGDAVDGRSERTMYAKQLDQYNKATGYIDNWKSILTAEEQKKWNALKPVDAISKDNVNHLKKFSFPVYAMGYNWLQTNKESASLINDQLKKIKAELGGAFTKFIIVSHSMGGLVTRSLIQKAGNDVLGVIHGVMPADGAAAAYRRIVSGSWEGKNNANVMQFGDWIAANIMGRHTESVTAVLANAPGGLELLPNRQYNSKKPWLHLAAKDGTGAIQKVSLPRNGDPYTDIYKRDGVWWEMVKEELLDPAKMIKVKPGDPKKTSYYQLIDDVKNFHNSVLESFHRCTYANWGNTKNNSFAELTWMLSQNLAGMNPKQLEYLPRANQSEINTAKQIELSGARGAVDDKKIGKDNDGIRYISLKSGKLANFTISRQDGNGDGTVPAISGQSPYYQVLSKNKVPLKQGFPIAGFGHQDSYLNINIQRTVLYSIVHMIKDNNIRPKNR